MPRSAPYPLSLLLLGLLEILVAGQPARLAETYEEAIRKINEDHARRPGGATEVELARKVPRAATEGLQRLLKEKPSGEVIEALKRCGEAALDLDLPVDFAQVRKRLLEVSPEAAEALGTACSRPRFLLRGLGGLDQAWLEGFAQVLEGVLQGYDEVFGFAEWSKVPGKKLRVRLHREEQITRPPHFAPQFPFHSEIDFPVPPQDELRSPTPDGKFLFYGICHELGHVIAMWGRRDLEEDHHAWAHYTGVAVVEHLAAKARELAWMKNLRDQQWRSLEIERKRLKDVEPSLDNRDGVLSLLITLHDTLGGKALGAAINHLDQQDRRLRINKVRYYTFKELRAGLEKVVKDRKALQRLRQLLP